MRTTFLAGLLLVLMVVKTINSWTKSSMPKSAHKVKKMEIKDANFTPTPKAQF